MGINLVGEMISYPFMTRAIVVGVLVALCAALLGVSLVLKRYAMIGDGLSHVGFAGLAIAMGLSLAPLYVSIPLVLVAAFLLLRISENSSIKGDSAIALISTGSLAVGVMIISMSSGLSTDVCNVMFGSILAMKTSDVIWSVALSIVVLSLYLVFYEKIFAVTFDEDFAKATGTKAGTYNMLLAFLTAITIVLGMQLMGTLLISALVIFPGLTSMRLFKSFRGVVLGAAVLSVVCFMIGITISYGLSTPAGASVVCVHLVVFCVFSVIGTITRRQKIG